LTLGETGDFDISSFFILSLRLITKDNRRLNSSEVEGRETADEREEEEEGEDEEEDSERSSVDIFDKDLRFRFQKTKTLCLINNKSMKEKERRDLGE
jgi:hypothetical protein